MRVVPSDEDDLSTKQRTVVDSCPWVYNYSGTSLINMEQKHYRGPKNVPWGTPDVTSE